MLAALQNVRPSHLLDRVSGRPSVSTSPPRRATRPLPTPPPTAYSRGSSRPRRAAVGAQVLAHLGVKPAVPAGAAASSRPPEAWLARWRGQGATTQAFVPGVYAWAVTVLPVVWAHGAPLLSMVAAGLGPLCLASGPIVERYRPNAARMAAGLGMVATSLVVWVLAPEGSVGAFDAARGIAGMFGWGLFAFALSSPAGPALPAASVARTPAAPPSARRVDTPVLLIGLALAVRALELPGWHLPQRERALLVRLIGLAGGLAVVTIASQIAVGGESRRAASRTHTRPRMGRASSRAPRDGLRLRRLARLTRGPSATFAPARHGHDRLMLHAAV